MAKIVLNENIISVSDLREVISELEAFKKFMLHQSIKQQVNARSSMPEYDLSITSKTLLTDWQNKKPLTTESIEDLITELKHSLNHTPLVSITLAALPTKNIKKVVANWFRSNISSDVLIDFNYSSSIMGGMVVSIGSRTFDLSFARQINNAKDKLNQVVKNV